MKYRRIGCIGVACVVLLALIVVCAIDSYRTTTWSAHTYLARLSGLPQQNRDLQAARAALLQRMPVGTSAANIVTFLETHGIERDQFIGGQSMRYQVQPEQRAILALLTDTPLLAFPCNGTGYIIRFQLDTQERVTDIGIQTTGACL